MDLRRDDRTARAYAFGNGVSPTKDVAALILSTLRSDENALFISAGRSYGLRAGALVVTDQRVLLVPPPGQGPVDAMSRSEVSGVVAARAGVARVVLRLDTDPHTRSLDRVPATLVDDLRRALPRLEAVAGLKEVRLWAGRVPPRRPVANPVAGRPPGGQPVADAARQLWKTTVDEFRTALAEAQPTSGRAAVPPPPAPGAPRMRPTATPGAPVLLSGGPPALTWKEAEALAAVAMVHLGFPDALVTAGGKDDGVDVVARGAVAQVKYWQGTVGAPFVRDLLGAATAAGAKALFFSLGGYTAEATAFAERAAVCLFTFTTTGTVVAASPSARTMMIEAITRLADPAEQRRLQAERSAFEATAQEVDRLTARATWLADAAKRTQRTVRGRAASKTHERALFNIQSALNALNALDLEFQQGRREALTKAASAHLRRAAKDLGVKAP